MVDAASKKGGMHLERVINLVAKARGLEYYHMYY
jgi:hypothetical protein